MEGLPFTTVRGHLGTEESCEQLARIDSWMKDSTARRPIIRPHMTSRLVVLVVLLLDMSSLAHAQSVFTTRPDDPAAVTVTAQDFGVRGDGTSDDTGGIQAAIDKATTTPNGGIVFVPSGRYRVTRTIYVWRGVRVIGYGATRPVFVLADNTPGLPERHRADGDVHAAGRPGRRSAAGQHPRAVSSARQRAAARRPSPTPDRARSIRR